MPQGADFYNPYRLLQQPGPPPQRRYRVDHSRIQGYVGRLEVILEAHTPFEARTSGSQTFNSRPRVAGSSLKGVIRSMAEFVGGGCVSVRSRNISEGDWSGCQGDMHCVTCDMFGMMGKGSESVVAKGKVRIGDATPVHFARHIALTILFGPPKESHQAFYPRSQRGQAPYRKFYHHQPWAPEELPRRGRDKGMGKMAPATLNPVAAGSTFAFIVDFDSLDAGQLALLLYALELEPGLLHKMGRGKAHGLGSVKLRVTRLQVLDGLQRLKGEGWASAPPAPIEVALAKYAQSPNLNSFRRMVSWEAASALRPMKYPGYRWFRDGLNSQTLLRSIDTVVPGAPVNSVDPALTQLRTEHQNERPRQFAKRAKGITSVVLSASSKETQGPSQPALPARAEAPFTLAIRALESTESAKDVRKKVLAKHFDALSETEKATLARAILDRMSKRGWENELPRMPSLKGYV